VRTLLKRPWIVFFALHFQLRSGASISVVNAQPTPSGTTSPATVTSH
jgi:hypothetical protein